MKSQKSSKSLSKMTRKRLVQSHPSDELSIRALSKKSSSVSPLERRKTSTLKTYKNGNRNIRSSRIGGVSSSKGANPNPMLETLKESKKELTSPPSVHSIDIQNTRLYENSGKNSPEKPKTKRSHKGAAYLRTKVKTASGGELVIMLYEKAISNLTIACDLINQNPSNSSINIEIGSNIRNAQEIILELLYSLDIETGGEFARKMSAVYSFMNRELSEAIIERSDARIRPILEQLKVLLEAWKKAHEQVKAQEQLSRPNSEGVHLGS